VRYEDGHEDDVCAGAVHRPAITLQLRRRTPPTGGVPFSHRSQPLVDSTPSTSSP
jgi:hypothetical protein